MSQQHKSTIFFIILALILIAGGVWYTQRPAPETPPSTSNEAQAVDNAGSAVVDDGAQNGEVDTSDWKIYRNETHKYTIKYPNNLTLFDDYGTPDHIYIGKDGSYRSPAEGIKISVTNNSIADSISQIKNRDELTSVSEESTVNINGILMNKLIVTAAIGFNDVHHFFKRNNLTFEIESANNSSVSREQEKMLSTFKFLND